MFEIQKPHLQKIIGVDKKNPVFTVWQDPDSSGGIHVYFGTELMEVVSEDRHNPQMGYALDASAPTYCGFCYRTVGRIGNFITSLFISE